MTDLPVEIDVASVKKKLDAGEDLLLIDVREPSEHETAHIAAAKLVPMGEIQDRLSELEPHKTRPVVVHCHHGLMGIDETIPAGNRAVDRRKQETRGHGLIVGGNEKTGVAVEDGAGGRAVARRSRGRNGGKQRDGIGPAVEHVADAGALLGEPKRTRGAESHAPGIDQIGVRYSPHAGNVRGQVQLRETGRHHSRSFSRNRSIRDAIHQSRTRLHPPTGHPDRSRQRVEKNSRP